MEYFIAYLLTGEAKAEHEALAAEIADRFGVFRLNDHIPPHMTLKVPFETENIEDVEKALEAFAGFYPRTGMSLDGFNVFGREVIFVSIRPSFAAAAMVYKLMAALKKIRWMKFEKFDVEKKLHSTIARRGIEEKFDEIREFVSARKFKFAVEFDNVSILRKDGACWVVHRTYSLK